MNSISVVRRGAQVILVCPGIAGKPGWDIKFAASEAILFGEQVMSEAKAILGHKIETLAGIKQMKEDQIAAQMLILQIRCENIVRTGLEASPPWANARIVKNIVEECAKALT